MSIFSESDPQLAFRPQNPAVSPDTLQLLGVQLVNPDHPEAEQQEREVASDIVDHIRMFVKGEEASFSRYFMFDERNHMRLHERFVEEAGLPGIDEQGEPTTVILLEGEASLVREVHAYANGKPCGVFYFARRSGE